MKKKISKYFVASISATVISAAVVCAAVSCSSVNSLTSSVKTISTKLSATNANKVDGNNYYANYGSVLTLKTSNDNFSSGTVTYSFYCNNNILVKQAKNSTYQIVVNQTPSSYYVIAYVNGVKEATSNTIKVIPLFDANKFSAAIYENTNNNLEQVSMINDVNNTKSYNLIYHVLYDTKIFNDINSKVIWTINGQISNNNNSTIDISNLKPGINTISVATSFTIPNSNQTINIKPVKLIINVAQLEITGNNVNNNQVTVNYNGSVTLKLSDASLSTLTDNNKITNLTYQWYEINDEKQTIKLNGETNNSLKLMNLTNSGTYYLVVSWNSNNEVKTLTSNYINVNVNITNSEINQIIANKLDSILNQEIEVSDFSTISAADAINSDATKLESAIITSIENEISSSNKTFVINSISYSLSDIDNGLKVSYLPTSISPNDDEAGIIPGVTLSYNGITLTPKSGSTNASSSSSTSNTFTVKGFSNVTADQIGTNNNRNNQVATSLDSILNQEIEVTGFSAISAADAINSDATKLESAIISAIETEIANSEETFNIDGISYPLSDIDSGLKVNSLPTSISQSDDENGIIPGVALSYNGITLTPKSSSTNASSSSGTSNTFSVKGFSSVTADQIATNNNNQIASKLDSLLNQIINIGSDNSMSSYTAADALNNASSDNLTTAIVSAIKAEIGTSSFDIDGIAYTADQICAGIEIGLPKTITLQDDENAQIPGVTLTYNDISLTWKNSSSSSSSTTSSSLSSNSDFIVEGFTKASSTQAGYNPGGQGNTTNRNHQIATILDSILNQEIEVSGFSTITASNAIKNDTTSLKTAIINAIETEIANSKETFNIDAISYTLSEIDNGLNVAYLPSSISSTDNENMQIPGVQLSYNSINLTPKTTTSTSNSSTNTFTIIGFKKPVVLAELSCNATSSSPYVYNAEQSKLVVWGNGATTDTNTVDFEISGISYNASNKYQIKFFNTTSSNTISINLSNNEFSIPVSDFNGYNSLELLINDTVSSQVINYQYLATKPYLQIGSSQLFNSNTPQITLTPNEDLGSCMFDELTAQDLNITIDINNTTLKITSTTVTIPNEGTISLSNIYSIKTSGQDFIITFNKSTLDELLNVTDSSGNYTTMNVTFWINPTTLNNNQANQLTLDGETIIQSQNITKTFAYANTNNGYIAGIYYNDVPVTSVLEGSSNVTLQVTGLSNGDKVQWEEEVAQGQDETLTNADITVNNNNNTASYSLPAATFVTAGSQLTYIAVITTSSGATITTNPCTVTVTSLGTATITVQGVEENTNNSSYDLTSNTSYNIQTSNNSAITLNDDDSGTTYYQWQYKSNSVILGGLASNSTWTNLGDASSVYTPYEYAAIPMYSVSFRLVVFSDKNVPTSFNPETNLQYIVSNTINTAADFTSTFSLTTPSNTITLGQNVTYTLNSSEQNQLQSLIEHTQYQYANSNQYFIPAKIEWYYENTNDTSISDLKSPIEEDILFHDGQLTFATYDATTKQYSYTNSLSYTFNTSLLTQTGKYNIYAKILFTDNFTPYSTSTYSLTVQSNLSNYEQALEKYIENWANQGNEDIQSTSSSSSTQPNTSFTNFVQQNTQGVKILSPSTDFSDIKVSFTKLPSSDDSALGTLANDEWLTITATSNADIQFTQWEGNTWGTTETNNVQQGYIFTWTLPYNLSSITYTNGNIELPINQTALTLQNNTDAFNGSVVSPNLPIPFGLAIGTASKLTSVSSTWGSSIVTQYDGYICTNFGTGQNAFSLPSPWVVPYDNNAATYTNLFVNKMNSKLINFTNIDSDLITFYKHY